VKKRGGEKSGKKKSIEGSFREQTHSFTARLGEQKEKKHLNKEGGN